jgi:serine/threonine-protein kinase HipA
VHEKKLRLAMKIGGDYGIFPSRNTWPGAATDLKPPPDELVDRVRELASRAPDAFAEAAKAADIKELRRPLSGNLVDLVADRAGRCMRLIDRMAG